MLQEAASLYPTNRAKRDFLWNISSLLKSATPWGVANRGPSGPTSTYEVTAWSQLSFLHSGLCSPSMSLHCIVVLMLWKCFAWICGQIDWGCSDQALEHSHAALFFACYWIFGLCWMCLNMYAEKQELLSQFLFLFCLGCDKQGHTRDLALHSVCFWGVN